MLLSNVKIAKDAACGFELIYYFNSAQSTDRESVGATRFQAGCELAKIYGIKGDIVVPVPNTAREVAKGYSYVSGIKFGEVILAKKECGRYFTKKTQEEREKVANEKFIYLPEEIKGKEVILIDDSIVRGTTTRSVIRHLREYGASKIHMLVASSPVINTCEKIMVASRGELIATDKTIGQIRKEIGADTLHYLPLDIAQEIYGGNKKLCLDCFS
jgi:amidophosphoribosyltransferase